MMLPNDFIGERITQKTNINLWYKIKRVWMPRKAINKKFVGILFKSNTALESVR